MVGLFRHHFPALASAVIFLILPRALRAEVTAEIVTLGDGGRALIGQPVYADAVYKNDSATPLMVRADETIDRWEFREGSAGAVQACSSKIRVLTRTLGRPTEPVLVLKPAQSRVEREIILDLVCANLPTRAGTVFIRVRLEGIEQSAGSPWKQLDLVAPSGREAQAIAAAPHAHNDLEDFLKKFGDTAIAAPFLRRLNEIEAGQDWTTRRRFDDRVRALSTNARWMKSVSQWRLQRTEMFLQRHPDSYFATELSTELAAMYATRGLAGGVERMARALSRTDPDQAAQIRETVDRLRPTSDIPR